MNSSLLYKFCNPNKQVSTVSFLLNGPLTSLFVLCGIIGNIVWMKYLIKQTTSRWAMFLITLALWDSMLLLNTFGFYGLAVLARGKKPWNGIFSYFYLVFYPLVNFAMAGSIWTVLAISIERYMALAKPLLLRVRGETITVKRISKLVAIGVLLISFPTVLELRIVKCFSVAENRILPQIEQTALRMDKTYLFLYRVVCYLLFVSLLPFILILFFTIRIQFIRRTAQGSRANLRAEQAQCFMIPSDTTSVLLTGMVIKFLLCYSSPTLLNIFELANIMNTNVDNVYFDLLTELSNFLVVLHSGTNWIIYYQWSPPQSLTTAVSYMELESLDNEQVDFLADLFSHLDLKSFSQEMIKEVSLANPTLRKYFEIIDQTERDSTMASPVFETEKITQESERMAPFLNELIDAFANGHTEMVVRKLRWAGESVYSRGIKMSTRDWFLIKHYIISRFLAVTENPSQHEERVITRFVCFVIGELKSGTLCYADEDPSTSNCRPRAATTGALLPSVQYQKPRKLSQPEPVILLSINSMDMD